MRNWFWLAILSKGRLQWPRWFVFVLTIFLIGILAAGLIYAFAIFHAIDQRSHSPHVPAHSSQ